MPFVSPVRIVAEAAAARTGTAWLVTFTDLVALLLTFFVMLFSMSNVQVDKWKEMIDTLSQTLNPNRIVTTEIPSSEYNISSVFRKRAINLDYLIAVLDQKVKVNDLLADSLIVLLEDRLVISLPGSSLFQPGGADLSDGAREALFDLGGVLRNIDNQIGVNGYAEADSANLSSYVSDWELSLARSVVVANALKRAGYGSEIFSFGYGKSRGSALEGLPDDKKDLLARRIDIVIMSTGNVL